MAGARNKNWIGGARSRIYLDSTLLGLAWHPHVFGEGWLDSSGETSVQPDFTIGPSQSATLTQRGHICPVRVKYEVNGEPTEDIISVFGGLPLNADASTVIRVYHIQGV